MKRHAVFALNAAAATLSLAQTLPPVTVTATRTESNPFDVPASVSVIDGDALRSAGRPEVNLSESIDIDRWSVAAAARVDNVFDRRYAGSGIVNEGNGRYYEPATGRNYTLKLTGTYAF